MRMAAISAILFFAALLPFGVYAVEPPEIQSAAAVVIDFETGEVLFERDAHSLRPPASLTKSMTAFVVYEEIARGNLTLDTIVRIPDEAFAVANDREIQGSRVALPWNDRYVTIDKLLHLIMLPSSNGAATALAYIISGSEEAFAELMNQTAAEFGFFTDFTHSHGAFVHMTTAYAMGRLVYHFIHRHPDIIRITSRRSFPYMGDTSFNTNRLFRDFPFEGADGFKTGTTLEALPCFQATAVRDGRRIITVVLRAPSNSWRYYDTHALLEFGFAEAARRDAERQALAEAERIQQEISRVLLDTRSFSVYISGSAHEFDTAPRMQASMWLAPAHELLYALGASQVFSVDTTLVARMPNDEFRLFFEGDEKPPVLISDEWFICVLRATEVLGFSTRIHGGRSIEIIPRPGASSSSRTTLTQLWDLAAGDGSGITHTSFIFRHSHHMRPTIAQVHMINNANERRRRSAVLA